MFTTRRCSCVRFNHVLISFILQIATRNIACISTNAPISVMVVTLKFRGSSCLRQRITLSLLTGKAVLIEDIRPDEDGLRNYELSLLELVDKLTSGTKVQIKGERLLFSPGAIVGGDITHDCDEERSISYYLELLLVLAPFCKKPLKATLNGVTNDQIDPNVDQIKASALPLMKRFIGDVEGAKLDIKINSRGFKPEGGGQIVLTCPIVRQLLPVQLTDEGKIKRIRGVAVAARVSPQMANRMIDTSKGMLLDYLPDVYIYSDHHKGKSSGLSPGFSIVLSAESTDGCVFTSSATSNSKGSGQGPSIPEDIAKEATYCLFEELDKGGCVDSICQGLALTLMAFNQKDVSRIKLGSLTTYSIHLLRHLKEFCGLTFQLTPANDHEVLAVCSGVGYKNLSRSTY